MLSKNVMKSIAISFLGIILFFGFAGNAKCNELNLDQSSFVAAGYHETLLHIAEPGRYSIQTHSQQGTAVELVDRMAGPVVSDGIVGEQDGRLDVFLDKGIYKLRLYSHKNGKGEVILDVFPFQEVQPGTQLEDIPLLEDLKLENSTLGDLQQRSFWVYLKERQALRLEAMGRNLEDCRLWRNADWLVDASPSVSTYEPVAGQPMTYIEFHHDLNPGLYRLTCYGGQALAWANDSPESPFHLRMGIPKFGTNGQQILSISPFGRDVFVVSGQTDFFELTRKDKKETLLGVSSWNQEEGRHRQGRQAAISKKSRDPWCSLTAGNGNTPQFVTIQATPGDNVVLKYFPRRSHYNFPRHPRGKYWISNQSSAAASDAIDATALLTRSSRSSSRTWVEQSRAIEVGFNQTYYRKINLLGSITVFLRIVENGTYIIEESPDTRAKGEYKIEPVWSSKPKDYVSPPFTLPETPLELKKGFYTLTITPRFKGILTFVLRKKGSPPSFQPLDDKAKVNAQRILWPQVSIMSDDDYTLTLSKRSDVVSGLIIRRLPLDLHDPLPVRLLPGEQVPLHIKVKEESTLIIGNDQDSAFDISGYPQPIASGSLLSPGGYTLKLQNSGQQTTLFTVKTVPAHETRRLTKDELTRKVQERASLLVLTEKNPIFRNFNRAEKQHFTLLVEEPGLYRLETSGRLATHITVRTRLITALFSAERNGIGRNALVQQYLRPGEYQITVQTMGRSKGRAGIHLRQTALKEEDGLRAGVRKKIRLFPDAAIRYRFEIEQAGTYRLRTLGLNKTFAWRLEDQDGWPLVRPNQRGEIQREFDAHSYYYYSLPEAVESLRITLLDPIKTQPRLEGKGPHTLVFNKEIQHVWREEPGRPPDVFALNIPDPVKTTVYLAEDMEAAVNKCPANIPVLSEVEGEVEGAVCDEEIAWIRGGLPKEFGKLFPGRYELHVRSIVENDRLPYTLLVKTDWLISGVPQTMYELPASSIVSTGDDSLVDISSFGSTDVKATLGDEGQLIAQHDDMENDWNFRISRKLKAGTYLLKLEQVGSDPVDEFEIRMTKREEVFLPSQEFPFTVNTEVTREVVTIPFTTDTTEQIIRFHTTGHGSVKMALFKEKQLLVENEGDIFIPLKARTRYTLLLWRLDQSTGLLTLDAQPLAAREIILSSDKTMLENPSAEFAAFKLQNADKISYMLSGQDIRSGNDDAQTIFFCPHTEQAFKTVKDVPVVMDNHSGWLLWKTVAQTPPFAKTTMTKNIVIIVPFSLNKDVTLVKPGRSALPFDFEQSLDAPMLLEIHSVGANLGAMAVSREHDISRRLHWFGMWMEPSQTLVAIPGKGTYRGKIWSTSTDAVRSNVRIHQRSFPLKHQSNWENVVRHEGKIQPGESHKINLDASPHTLNVLLSKGLVAFVWQNGQTEAIAAAINRNLQQQINVGGGELFLLNAGGETAVYRIEKEERVSEIVQTLDETFGFERVFTRSGKILLNIPKTGKTIFVAGDHVESRFLRDDGQVVEAHEMILSQIGRVQQYQTATGVLELRYQPGYGRVWQSTPQSRQQHFMGDFPEIAAENLQHEEGPLQNDLQIRTFSVNHPTYIIAQADTPGITAITSQNRILATSVSSRPTGRQIEYFLQPGEYQIWTRPLKGLRQNGTLYLHKITPYSLDNPALSKTWLIHADETQVFHFRISAKTTAGIGVQTESDRLESRLFNRQFTVIAEGPLIVQEMEAGEYILTVKTNDSTLAPVQYRPVLFGRSGSLQKIPAEVIEQYQLKIED